MNTGDVIQIDTPEFDPDIDGRPPTKEQEEIQGPDSSRQHLLGESKKSEAPAYHDKLQKKWIGETRYQSRSRHKQPRTRTTT